MFAPSILVVLFASCLLGSDRLAFRDVSHFYTPLYDYLGERNDTQWLPLWNPLDQTGVPVAGETTTAVFYPPRLLIYRMFDGPQAMAWYVVLHLVLASISTVIATRRITGVQVVVGRMGAEDTGKGTPDHVGIGWLGQTVAAIVYSMSGSVLFLYTNPPFLVSAAWLPLVMSMLIDPSCSGVRKRFSIGATAMAMMILGGDPQTAMHVMMVAVVVAIIRTVLSRSTGCSNPRMDPRAIRDMWIVLAITPVAAAILAAPQLMASVDWSRQSDRINGVSETEAMQYSIPPWHFLELFAANVSGELLPIHARISSLVPADGRMWTPTLFMGVLPLWMLFQRVFVRRRTDQDRYLLIALIATVFSMGHFGVYSLLYRYVPGYDAFRYPAKWLPMFAFGCAMATGVWIHHFRFRESKRSAVLLMTVLVAFFLATYLAGYLAEARMSINEFAPLHDRFWGPLDVPRGLWQIRWSLASSLAVLTVVWGCLRTQSLTRSPIAFGLLLIIGGHGYASVRSLLWTVNMAEESRLTQVFSIDPPRTSSRWMRTQVGDGWPQEWKTTSDTHRLADVEASQRMSHFGRWHLEDRMGVFNNFVSIRSNEQSRFWRSIREREGSDRSLDWSAIRHWLGVAGRMEQAPLPQEKGHRPLAHSRWILDENPGSTAHLAKRWSVVSPAQQQDNTLLDSFMQERLAEISSKGEWANRVMILGDEMSAPKDSSKPDQLVIKSETNEEFVAEVVATQGIAVVRSTLQDGNWNAAYRELDDPASHWRDATVHQADFLKQTIVLPPGRWTVRFWYWPHWMPWCLGIAAAGWVAMTILLMTGWEAYPTQRHAGKGSCEP